MSFFAVKSKYNSFPMLFKIVNDLQSLNKYNWNSSVYEYLVKSLCSASLVLRNNRNTSYFHVVGCAYLLQVKHLYLVFIVTYLVYIIWCCMTSLWFRKCFNYDLLIIFLFATQSSIVR